MPNLSKWRLWVGYGLLAMAVLTDSALWLLSVLMDGVMVAGGLFFIMSYVAKEDKKHESQASEKTEKSTGE